jgi:hypothetical protein
MSLGLLEAILITFKLWMSVKDLLDQTIFLMKILSLLSILIASRSSLISKIFSPGPTIKKVKTSLTKDWMDDWLIIHFSRLWILTSNSSLMFTLIILLSFLNND